MPYKDPLDPRNRAARLKHYYANKEQYFERNRKAKAEMREFINSFKRVPCHDCNIEYPTYVMQFDHVGSDKEYTVSSLVNYGNKNKLLLEIKKCEVVCANCHAERTHSRGVVARR
jgi:hypothetical protein